MAGHSQFKNIMHRKGAQDQKRAKIFTKIVREIVVAVKTAGPDAGSNPRLRAATQAARKINMPKDKIEGAIKKAQGNDAADNYDEIRYEGYGPGGVAVMVEALTDNRNRTAAEIRSAFTKYGGNLGETGSVNFMFDKLGVIVYPAAKAGEEAMLEAAIEAGAQDCRSDAEMHEITCLPDDLAAVREALEKKLGEPESAKISWVPKNTQALNEEQAQGLLKLVEVLEDNDDVQNVVTNMEITDAILKKLSA